MPVAHLIHGYLGSGKTTFAKGLESNLKTAVRFSPDDWLTRLYGNDPPIEGFNDRLERVMALINQIWPSVLAGGSDVILDFGFWSRSSRDAARRGALEAGAGVRLYWLRCAEGLARDRCRARNRQLEGSFFIADATFDTLKEGYEPLGADEQFEVVDTDTLTHLPGG